MTASAAGRAPERDEPHSAAEEPHRTPSVRPGSRGIAVDLQSRINSMQAPTLDSRNMPTVPALARILPGGGLRSGGSYSVRNSTTLAMALLAGPSATGAWCSVIGVPDFSVEAAQGFGINLERLILIPDPGTRWLMVTAALVDVVSIILTRAPEHLAPTEWARLRARLRQRGATLITLGAWKQSDSTLGVAESAWEGLGPGTGHLRGRRMRITATQPSGRLRHAYVGLTELQGGTAAAPSAASRPPGPAPDVVTPAADGSTLFEPALFEPALMKSS